MAVCGVRVRVLWVGGRTGSGTDCSWGYGARAVEEAGVVGGGGGGVARAGGRARGAVAAGRRKVGGSRHGSLAVGGNLKFVGVAALSGRGGRAAVGLSRRARRRGGRGRVLVRLRPGRRVRGAAAAGQRKAGGSWYGGAVGNCQVEAAEPRPGCRDARVGVGEGGGR